MTLDRTEADFKPLQLWEETSPIAAANRAPLWELRRDCGSAQSVC